MSVPMASFTGSFIGALILTYMLSALAIWSMKTWAGGVRKLCIAHFMALLAVTLIAGMGKADGGAFAPVAAFNAYALPQLCWLIFDIVMLKRRVAKARRLAAQA